jgi:N-acetylglucosamine kinase-like BadF-type ATPase
MTWYLAIDGGNSKTDVVVGADDGRVAAYARGGGTCYQNIGLPEAMTRLRQLVDHVRTESGITTFDRADVFLAGADLPSEVDMLTTSVLGEGWTSTLHLDNDTFALLRAGTDNPDAVAVVCGAGTNCVGRTQDGRSARFPSLGAISGDWGGGGHLAAKVVWYAVRGEDGRGETTALTGVVADHFGLSTMDDVAAGLHLKTLEWSRLQDLTPLLFEVAAAGDQVARSIVHRQAAEVVALATVAARRLDLLGVPFDVVLGGGVLRAKHPLLIGPVTSGINELAPKATVIVVDQPPVLGAALSSLDAFGAGPAVREVLRSALQATRPTLVPRR